MFTSFNVRSLSYKTLCLGAQFILENEFMFGPYLSRHFMISRLQMITVKRTLLTLSKLHPKTSVLTWFGNFLYLSVVLYSNFKIKVVI